MNDAVLQSQIENLKEDLKEVKQDNKETDKYFRDVIDQLKENSIRQTDILDSQIKQQEKQFEQFNKQVASLNDKIDNKMNSQTKWYQDFFDKNFGLVFKILIILIVLLVGVKLAGIDIGSLLSKAFN